MSVLEEFAGALLDRAKRGLAPDEVRETRRTLLNVVGTSLVLCARERQTRSCTRHNSWVERSCACQEGRSCSIATTSQR